MATSERMGDGGDTRKELGRIQSIRVGHGGYQDAMFGATFTLGGKGWGVNDFWGMWSPALVPRTESAKWTEAERAAQFDELCRRLDGLLKEAGVNDVMKLVGQPVEITFKNYSTLDSWRLLTEVLP